MGHYDDYELSQEEKDKNYLADKARDAYIMHKDILKNSLLRRYLDKHSNLKDCEYDHSESYWNKHTEEILKLIKKSDKKIKGE